MGAEQRALPLQQFVNNATIDETDNGSMGLQADSSQESDIITLERVAASSQYANFPSTKKLMMHNNLSNQVETSTEELQTSKIQLPSLKESPKALVDNMSFRTELSIGPSEYGIQNEGNLDLSTFKSNLNIDSKGQIANYAAPQIESTSIPKLTMIDNPLSPSFHQSVSDKVQWVITNNTKEAVIQLHPQELGQITAKVKVENDQMEVVLIPQTATVKEALDSNIQQLKALLSDANSGAVNVSVQQNNEQNNGQSQEQTPSLNNYSEEDTSQALLKSTTNIIEKSDKIIDVYI